MADTNVENKEFIDINDFDVIIKEYLKEVKNKIIEQDKQEQKNIWGSRVLLEYGALTSWALICMNSQCCCITKAKVSS